MTKLSVTLLVFVNIIIAFNAFCYSGGSQVNAAFVSSFSYPKKCRPGLLPKVKYSDASRLLSVMKETHTLPDLSYKVLSTNDADFLYKGQNFKPLVVETNTHYTLQYACVSLHSAYDEKHKFHSIYFDWHDPIEHTLHEHVYDEVIFLKASWQQFGHHIHDGFISNLFALPRDIVRRSTVALRFNMDLSKKYIDILGIEHGPYLEMQPNISYLCRILHVIEPETQEAGQLYSTRLAVEQIRRNLKLDEIQPSIGLFNNRKKNPRGRHILNFHDIVSRVKQNHPEEKFIIMTPEEMENLTYSVKLFAAAKYFIVTTGSGPINAIFMKPKTGISILGSNSFDLNVLATCSSLDIWVTYCSNQKLRNFPQTAAEREANIDIDRNMKYIERMFYAVKNQKWPELDHSTVKLWDYQKLARYYHIELSS